MAIIKFTAIFIFMAAAIAGCASSDTVEKRGLFIRTEYRNDRVMETQRYLLITVKPSVINPKLVASFQVRKRLESEACSWFTMYLADAATERKISDLQAARDAWKVVTRMVDETYAPSVVKVLLNGRPLSNPAAIVIENSVLTVNVPLLLPEFGGVTCEISVETAEDNAARTYTAGVDERFLALLREETVIKNELLKKPNDPALELALSKIYLRYGEVEAAGTELQRTFADGKQTLGEDELLDVGRLFYQGGFFKESAEVYKFLLADEAGSKPQYARLAALSLEKAGAYPEAEAFYRKAVSADPFNGEANLGLARTLLRVQKCPEAFAFAFRAKRILGAGRGVENAMNAAEKAVSGGLDSPVDGGNPASAQAWTEGLDFMKGGMWRDAVSAFSRALDARGGIAGPARKKIAAALVKSGEECYDAGKYTEALSAWNTALESDATRGFVRYNISMLYNKKAQFEKDPGAKESLLENAAFIDPMNVPALVNLGAAYLERGEPAKFRPVFNHLKRIAADAPGTLLLEACSHADRGEFPEAEAVLIHLKIGADKTPDMLRYVEFHIAEREYAEYRTSDFARADSARTRLEKLRSEGAKPARPFFSGDITRIQTDSEEDAPAPK
jgi:tetratricopeptide (TPR) repeat protein